MENNDLMMVNYETAFGNVKLDGNTVKDYLVKGNGKVSDQEVLLFTKMCQAQKLNPFVTGEVYLIKFGTQPAQMVVGYDTYKRRAEENPNHLYTESGIVVSRGSTGEIVRKSGACLYPTEKLVGGWCRVHKLRGEREVTTYKEVTFDEYDKKNAIWKEKPCTMIEKVAISQALREAYPTDYAGLYTAEELAPEQYNYINVDVPPVDQTGVNGDGSDELITQEERKLLFAKVREAFGKEEGENALKAILESVGLQSTSEMTRKVYNQVNDELDKTIKANAE